jgi:hypothetical protein
MWTWLEKFLQLIADYGFPLVTAALFLIIIPVVLRNLWREYRRLSERHDQLLQETSRLMEISSAESELARQTIDIAMRRLDEMSITVQKLIALLENRTDADPPDNLD